MPTPGEITAHGKPVPTNMLGELHDSTPLLDDPAALRKQIADDGYLYLRGVLDRNRVLDARVAVLSALADVGEIADPAMNGISTGTSRRGELVQDLGAFWQSLCENETVRSVTHSDPIVDVMERLLDGDVRAFDFLWMRTMHPGRASAYHFDHVYMNRGTDNLFTVWIPLGDVALDEGPLALVEGSHLWEDLIEEYRGLDVDRDTSRPGHVTLDPVALARERKTRLLTAEYRAGDIVIFPMFMLHGSLDNRSPEKRVRLSVDTRYQPANAPIDERWIGENPIAHGLGYAGMGGAKPATSDPLFR
jgi:ectoine hydroxylase-related dioxygenase (phytanoyl-CoA dioxygenase family)